MMSGYVTGSGIEVPGLEAVLEYGDASTIERDRIPSALGINDRSTLERVKLTQIDGLHDDPDGRDTRTVNPDRHGERAGQMLYGGRTIGLTGRVEAGNIRAMRDKWSKLRSTFGTIERDLLIHAPDEVPARENSIENPSFEIDASNWIASTTGSSATITQTVENSRGVGVLACTGLSGSGICSAQVGNPSDFSDVAPLAEWNGEDIFVSALVKVHAATCTVSSLTLAIFAYSPDGSGTEVLSISFKLGPVTGTWYLLKDRIGASELPVDTTHVAFVVRANTTGAGDATIRFDDAMLTLLDSSDSDPQGYFDGDTPGFEWLGDPHLSVSAGPYYSANKIRDPLFSATISSTDMGLESWNVDSGTGLTINDNGTASRAYSGAMTTRSAHFQITKDATATSRTMSAYVLDLDGLSTQHPIHGGRTYRWSFRINVLRKPSTGDLVPRIMWTLADGTTTSTSDGSAISAGVSDASVTATAPATAVAAIPFVTITTTSSGSVLEFFLADPCFVDITDYDPGSFVGTSDTSVESVPVTGSNSHLARRRIPRPLLIQRVRKTSDMKAPEKQDNFKAWRDFTMSLRASDPRIYLLDERRRSLTMTGNPKLVSRQAPDDFSLMSGSLGAPTGWTYEGNFVTHPGTGNPYNWSQDAWNYVGFTAQALHPNDGVGIRAWGSDGTFGTNRPASDLQTRMYRSSEGYTYDNPRVIMGCAPQGAGAGTSIPVGSDTRYFIYDINSGTIYYNQATILLKRVSATTWLELRWNSVSNALATRAGIASGPYAFELWCSHDSSGALATTRLAAWDYESFDSQWGFYNFRPMLDPMYLTAWMLDDVVNWELWSTYPIPDSTVGRVESGSFAIPSGLVGTIGSVVAGNVGMSLSISRSYSSASWETLASRPPFMHFFEASAADVPPQQMQCSVIGTVDTPQQLVLTGDLIDPVVTIAVPEYEGLPARTSVAKFSGTMTSAQPITIDLSDGSVKDSLGANKYGMVLPRSSFAMFRPGINSVSVQAKSWSSSPTHATAIWRDALR